MNYDGAVRYLFSLGRELAAPTQAAAAKFDLENTSVLAERLGRPDRAYPSAHIAGTNGKGSTAAFLESILRHAGFRTGLNTSPHLEKINERIRVSGEEISDAAFADVLTRIQSITEELLATGKLRAHPTYFECVTAMAFEYFAQQRVEFAIFEVGLGGRLDATNIVTPLANAYMDSTPLVVISGQVATAAIGTDAAAVRGGCRAVGSSGVRRSLRACVPRRASGAGQQEKRDEGSQPSAVHVGPADARGHPLRC